MALLILEDHGKGFTIHPDGMLCKIRKDLPNAVFWVVKHEDGAFTSASHYRPVLLFNKSFVLWMNNKFITMYSRQTDVEVLLTRSARKATLGKQDSRGGEER